MIVKCNPNKRSAIFGMKVQECVCVYILFRSLKGFKLLIKGHVYPPKIK